MIGTGPCGEWQKLALQNLGQLRVQKFKQTIWKTKYLSQLIWKTDEIVRILVEFNQARWWKWTYLSIGKFGIYQETQSLQNQFYTVARYPLKKISLINIKENIIGEYRGKYHIWVISLMLVPLLCLLILCAWSMERLVGGQAAHIAQKHSECILHYNIVISTTYIA